MSESTGGITTDVTARVREGWVAFACPACDRRLKIEENDLTNEIECPGCHTGLETVDAVMTGDEEARLSLHRVPHVELPESRPPKKGMLMDLSRGKTGFEPKVRPDRVPLPVRSKETLEERQRQASQERQMHPTVIQEQMVAAKLKDQDPSKYKRIKVRTRRRRTSEKKKVTRFYLLSALAAVFIATALISMMRWYNNRAKRIQEASLEEVVDPSTPVGPPIDKARDAVYGFLKATEKPVDEQLKYVRLSEGIRDRLKKYADTYNYRFGSVNRIEPDLALAHRYRNVVSGLVLREDWQPQPFYVVKTSTHGHRLDWESFVGYNEISWETVLEEQPLTPHRVRVWISRTNYYRGAYKDKNRHQSYNLTDAERSGSLYGYVRKSSPLDDAISRLLPIVDPGDKKRNVRNREAQAIVDIRFPVGGSDTLQVEIVRLANDNWFQP